MFSVLRNSIILKLAFVCILIFVLIGGIVTTSLFSFNEVKTLFVTLIERDVTNITHNARTGRELSQVFSDTNLLISTFIDQPDYVKTENDRLQEILQRNIATSVTGNAEELRQTLQDFTANLETLFNSCALVNETSEALERLHHELTAGLAELDTTLADTMITAMMEGNDDKIVAIEQLGTMLSGYRDTHSRIMILLAQLKQNSLRQHKSENEQRILELMKELHTNLMAVTRAGQQFAELGERLLGIVTSYQERIVQFHQRMNEFQTRVTRLKTSQGQLLENMEELDIHIVQATHDMKKDAISAIQESQHLMVSLSLIILTLLLGSGIYAIRLVTPLKGLSRTAHQLAEGNINCVIPEITSHDEIGALSHAMKELLQTLHDVVRHVKMSADTVAQGSQEMNVRVTDMSKGTTSQAAAAEEASASMEQMAANIRQNAENALQTEQIAFQAANDAHESGQAVAETVEAMREIAQKIAIIEEITRQTRLLSLNATIEAARAQQYGRGFTVVAAEVRALAERSQTAAAEINRLTSASVTTAEHAGKKLERLVPDIQKTAQLVQEISAASKEQTTGTGQINQAIQQLDHVTQQNAAASEELASTADNLAEQAEMLQQAISFFKLNKTNDDMS